MISRTEDKDEQRRQREPGAGVSLVGKGHCKTAQGERHARGAADQEDAAAKPVGQRQRSQHPRNLGEPNLLKANTRLRSVWAPSPARSVEPRRR